MLARKWIYFAAQIALIYIFGSLANIFQSLLFAIIWVVLALALGLYWEQLTGSRSLNQRHPQQPVKFLARAFSYSCGVGAAIVVSATDISLWHTRGFILSLVGVQFYIPLGAILLGAIVSTVYVWALALSKVHLQKSDLYVMASLSILSLAISYVIFFHQELTILSAGNSDFLRSVAQANLLGQKKQLYGLAPIPMLTPLIQCIGYIIGSSAIYWRARNRDV